MRHDHAALAAHTLTLGLTLYATVSVPPVVVEPLIALSISWVAIENLIARNLHPWRVAVVFGFGLLHGMGFAGVLTELHLPRADLAAALLSFDFGVEAGQLSVIALTFGALFHTSRRSWYRRYVAIPASCAIALTGLGWTVQRIAESGLR